MEQHQQGLGSRRVKPVHINKIAVWGRPALAPIAQARRPLVISIAAGITSTQLERWLGGNLPVVRAMPNTPALIGRGVTGISGGSRATTTHLALADDVFGKGAADRSYGVQVARLAGLPPAVVERAKAVLHQLEAGETSGKADRLVDDLPLFSVAARREAPASGVRRGRRGRRIRQTRAAGWIWTPCGHLRGRCCSARWGAVRAARTLAPYGLHPGAGCGRPSCRAAFGSGCAR